MNTSSELRYRPEIDGMRAIAVLFVVLFHAGLGVPGGYIGVDVFFVISGYLITSLIWRDLSTGRFQLGQFWERRIRRLAPALTCATLAVLAMGTFFLIPEDFVSLARAVAWQSVFAANLFYRRELSYFGTASDEAPLLHTWSLAVEEQFYLFAPFIMCALFRFGVFRTARGMGSALAVACLVSLVTSIYWVERSQPTAFYLLPSRAWELLLGSIVAFLPCLLKSGVAKRLRDCLAVLGLAALAVPAALYTEQTPFPGLGALVPCLGTALLIWVNARDDQQFRIPTTIGRILACQPLAFVGKVSYSLYLWHWPLLAFGNYSSLSPLTVPQRLALVVMSCGLSVLSWKFVELPFREKRVAGTRRLLVVSAATTFAIVLGLGLAIKHFQGFPQRFTPQALTFANSKSDHAFLKSISTEDVRAGNLVRLGMAPNEGAPKLLVWGDSHAMAALPAFDTLLMERGFAGVAATHSSTAPVLGAFWETEFGLGKRAPAFNAAIVDYVRRKGVHDVFLIARWSSYFGRSGGGKDGQLALRSSLLATVRGLVDVGARPWIVLDVPNQPFNVPRALARSSNSLVSVDASAAAPTKPDSLEVYAPGLLAQIEYLGGRIIDPKPRFLTDRGDRYKLRAGGLTLYRDDHHLTATGSRLVLVPLLREALRDVEATTPDRIIAGSSRDQRINLTRGLVSGNHNKLTPSRQEPR